MATGICAECDNLPGFKLTESTNECKEICGDGLNFGEHPCDDGNSNNGDGCDTKCNVEIGWTCSQGLHPLTDPDVCQRDGISAEEGAICEISNVQHEYEVTINCSEAISFPNLNEV